MAATPWAYSAILPGSSRHRRSKAGHRVVTPRRYSGLLVPSLRSSQANSPTSSTNRSTGSSSDGGRVEVKLARLAGSLIDAVLDLWVGNPGKAGIGTGRPPGAEAVGQRAHPAAGRGLLECAPGVAVPVQDRVSRLHDAARHSGQTCAGSSGSPGSALRPKATGRGRNRIRHAVLTMPRLSVPRWVSWSFVERRYQLIEWSSISGWESRCATGSSHVRAR